LYNDYNNNIWSWFIVLIDWGSKYLYRKKYLMTNLKWIIFWKSLRRVEREQDMTSTIKKQRDSDTTIFRHENIGVLWSLGRNAGGGHLYQEFSKFFKEIQEGKRSLNLYTHLTGVSTWRTSRFRRRLLQEIHNFIMNWYNILNIRAFYSDDTKIILGCHQQFRT